jgi:phage terminase Nu1 subunit (DNA packaging protein)
VETSVQPVDRLERVLTQTVFGELVGISQQAVSDLMDRGVIAAGDTAGAWLRAYCEHLRKVAAGRDPDGDLARERARLAKESADRVAMQNAEKRRELVPIELLTDALASVARQLATRLDTIVPTLRKRVPDLSHDALQLIETTLAEGRALAAGVTLESADDGDDDEDDA